MVYILSLWPYYTMTTYTSNILQNDLDNYRGPCSTLLRPRTKNRKNLSMEARHPTTCGLNPRHIFRQETSTCSYLDTWADPQSRSTLGIYNLYTLGVLESRVGFYTISYYIYAIPYYTIPYHIYHTSPDLEDLLFGSTRPGVYVKSARYLPPTAEAKISAKPLAATWRRGLSIIRGCPV